MIDAPLHIFDTSEYIGQGKQATLDIAIDESATQGRAEAPQQKAKQMPGQTEMES